MGLLDGFLGTSWDDPRTAQVLGLASGLLGANGSQGLAQGLLNWNQAGDNNLKNQLTKAQLDNYQSEVETRKQALLQAQQQQQMKQAWLNRFFGNGAQSQPAAPGQLGSGSFDAVAPAQGMPAIPAPNPRNPFENMSIGDVFAGQLAGVDALQPWKIAQEGIEQKPGTFYIKNGVKTFNADPNKANTVDASGRVMVQPGFNEALTGTTLAAELPKQFAATLGQVNLRKGDNGKEFPTPAINENPAMQALYQRYLGQPFPGAQQLGAPTAARPAASAPIAQGTTQISPDEQRARDAESIRVLQSELSAEKDPTARAGLQRELDRVTSAQAKPGFPTPSSVRIPSDTPPSPSQGYGKTTAQENAAEAGKEINKSWIKTSYEPTIAAINGARDLQENAQVARMALQNLGRTGWGTEAQAAAANVLTGIGMAPKTAEKFAANAQIFQSKAMDRLWTTLNEAKGPQTEGDASRASKTYAQLSNTPKANEFILDFAEAKAQRDQLKARFYQEALPVAQQKGDLAEVDREWAKRAPSIFTMPTMQRWGAGIK